MRYDDLAWDTADESVLGDMSLGLVLERSQSKYRRDTHDDVLPTWIEREIPLRIIFPEVLRKDFAPNTCLAHGGTLRTDAIGKRSSRILEWHYRAGHSLACMMASIKRSSPHVLSCHSDNSELATNLTKYLQGRASPDKEVCRHWRSERAMGRNYSLVNMFNHLHL